MDHKFSSYGGVRGLRTKTAEADCVCVCFFKIPFKFSRFWSVKTTNVWILSAKTEQPDMSQYCDNQSQREVLLLVSLCECAIALLLESNIKKKKKSDKLHMTGGKVSSRSQVYYKLVSFTVSAWFIWLRWGRWRQAESFLISFSIISTAVSQCRREAGEDVKPALDKSVPSAAVLHSWPC